MDRNFINTFLLWCSLRRHDFKQPCHNRFFKADRHPQRAGCLKRLKESIPCIQFLLLFVFHCSCLPSPVSKLPDTLLFTTADHRIPINPHYLLYQAAEMYPAPRNILITRLMIYTEAIRLLRNAADFFMQAS